MKIKVLHIIETIASGGVEKTRLSLARHLDKDRFEQKIICTHAWGDIAADIQREGVEIIPIGILKHPFQWSQHSKVQNIIDDYKPDIIHGAVFEGVTMAAINGWLKQVPYIIIEETSFPIYRSWRANLLMKLFSAFSHKVVGVSEGTTYEYLFKKLKLSRKKVALINNGVMLPRKIRVEEVDAARGEWGILPDDFVIGSVGRMWDDSNKRFSDLIEAFAALAAKRESVKLLLVGAGKEMERYKQLVQELRVLDKVIFTGYQSDVTLFYQMMHAFCLVSTHESFGLVLAEAMLNKLPVVATRVGGMKYIVDDGETGFLVQPKDVSDIAAKIELLYHDANRRKQMGEKGYKKAMQEYTEDIYVNKIANLYLKNEG